MAKYDQTADELQLEALGHRGELNRNFSPLSMLGFAFAILNTWTALSASMSLALPTGGSSSVVWGLLTAGVCNLCLAASLAEFLSAYPTAGGQYHWVAVISPKRWVPLFSWITGWINVSGWVALVASGGLLGSQLIFGVITLYHPSYVAERWHQFLIYIAYTMIAFFINAFLNSVLPYVGKAAIGWSIAGFFILSITILACSAPNYASAKFVFTDFVNETGWPDGIAWMLGLLQGGLSLTGYDAVAHIIEEIPNAAVEGPKIMVYAVGLGTFTGFFFVIILLFVSGGDTESIITSPLGPILRILYTATSSKVGAVCLLIFPLVCLLFGTTSIMATSSRMVYAFARDGGLPASRFFAKVHPRLMLPLNALFLTAALVIVFGLIFLGSSSAFNAILSSSVVALGVSYAIPPAANVLQGRKKLPADRSFVLPGALGWFANLLGIAYVIITTVLFVFPPVLPVTGSNMSTYHNHETPSPIIPELIKLDYCVVAFAIILIISVIQWFVDGRKNFTGPRTDIDLSAFLGADNSSGEVGSKDSVEYREQSQGIAVAQ